MLCLACVFQSSKEEVPSGVPYYSWLLQNSLLTTNMQYQSQVPKMKEETTRETFLATASHSDLFAKRDLSVATDLSLWPRNIFLWLQGDLSVAITNFLCGQWQASLCHRDISTGHEIFLCATERYLRGYRKILWGGHGVAIEEGGCYGCSWRPVYGYPFGLASFAWLLALIPSLALTLS